MSLFPHYSAPRSAAAVTLLSLLASCALAPVEGDSEQSAHGAATNFDTQAQGIGIPKQFREAFKNSLEPRKRKITNDQIDRYWRVASMLAAGMIAPDIALNIREINRATGKYKSSGEHPEAGSIAVILRTMVSDLGYEPEKIAPEVALYAAYRAGLNVEPNGIDNVRQHLERLSKLPLNKGRVGFIPTLLHLAILRDTANGLHDETIAANHKIAERKVTQFRGRMADFLQAQTNVDLIAKAYYAGLLDTQPPGVAPWVPPIVTRYGGAHTQREPSATPARPTAQPTAKLSALERRILELFAGGTRVRTDIAEAIRSERALSRPNMAAAEVSGILSQLLKRFDVETVDDLVDKALGHRPRGQR